MTIEECKALKRYFKDQLAYYTRRYNKYGNVRDGYKATCHSKLIELAELAQAQLYEIEIRQRGNRYDR